MKGGSAIIILLEDHNIEQLDFLKNSLRTLPFLQGDDPDALAPVLVFCEEENQLTYEDKASLASSTNRPITFPLIQQKHITKEQSKKELTSNIKVQGNNATAFKKKFWISKLHNHPALRNFDVVFKLNTNFCFRTFN